MTTDLARSSDLARWNDRAACAGLDTNQFYPEAGDEDGRIATAKAICRGCPVRVECLEYAMRHEQDRTRNGVWGGLAVSERHGLYRCRAGLCGHDGGCPEVTP